MLALRGFMWRNFVACVRKVFIAWGVLPCFVWCGGVWDSYVGNLFICKVRVELELCWTFHCRTHNSSKYIGCEERHFSSNPKRDIFPQIRLKISCYLCIKAVDFVHNACYSKIFQKNALCFLRGGTAKVILAKTRPDVWLLHCCH